MPGSPLFEFPRVAIPNLDLSKKLLCQDAASNFFQLEQTFFCSIEIDPIFKLKLLFLLVVIFHPLMFIKHLLTFRLEQFYYISQLNWTFLIQVNDLPWQVRFDKKKFHFKLNSQFSSNENVRISYLIELD